MKPLWDSLYTFTKRDVFSGINMGDCLLFIDTLNIAFSIDVKGYDTRSIESPKNEIVASIKKHFST